MAHSIKSELVLSRSDRFYELQLCRKALYVIVNCIHVEGRLSYTKLCCFKRDRAENEPCKIYKTRTCRDSFGEST